LNPKYLYVSIDALCLLVPAGLSLHRKINFSKVIGDAFLAIAIAALIFILWDAVLIYAGIRNINSAYTLGIDLLGVSLEDVLFFFCVPCAGLAAYFALNQLIEEDYLFPHQELITSVLIIVLLIFGLYNVDKAYTGPAFLITGLLLTASLLKLRMRFMGRFYFAFGIAFIPIVAIVGALTGTFLPEAIVSYDTHQLLGFRLGSIPLEDLVEVLLLLLLTTTIYEKLAERAGA
jgi:lycopene cyclase domain-containing protein